MVALVENSKIAGMTDHGKYLPVFHNEQVSFTLIMYPESEH